MEEHSENTQMAQLHVTEFAPLSRSHTPLQIVNQSQNSNNSTILKFNVGGRRFVTSKSTVYSHGTNFLTVLNDDAESGKLRTVTDDEGFIFIDRDGDSFAVILNYLRTGRVIRPNDVPHELVEEDFEFYQIKMPNIGLLEDVTQPHKKKAENWFFENRQNLLKGLTEQFQSGNNQAIILFSWYDKQQKYRCIKANGIEMTFPADVVIESKVPKLQTSLSSDHPTPKEPVSSQTTPHFVINSLFFQELEHICKHKFHPDLGLTARLQDSHTVALYFSLCLKNCF